MMEMLGHILIAVPTGFLLGWFFFRGLYWTLERAIASRRKGLWLAASFLVRVSLLLGGFYGVSNGHWERLVLCTLGFLVARKVVFRKLVPETARNPAGLKKDAVP